ncbi:hypothetical protein [Actinoplanes sp. OR16]|uniref:hypothetical protein n=1 Tax=Actinoplanes sp. OR16 TaxID=946334 RepID=UPI00135F1923|nr:hypothetical protein [Actinoplanes sp. OR16]
MTKTPGRAVSCGPDIVPPTRKVERTRARAVSCARATESPSRTTAFLGRPVLGTVVLGRPVLGTVVLGRPVLGRLVLGRAAALCREVDGSGLGTGGLCGLPPLWCRRWFRGRRALVRLRCRGGPGPWPTALPG